VIVGGVELATTSPLAMPVERCVTVCVACEHATHSAAIHQRWTRRRRCNGVVFTI